MEKVNNIFRPEYEKYIPILKNTKKDKVPTKRLPNEPWQIKGFGSKFAFGAVKYHEFHLQFLPKILHAQDLTNFFYSIKL